VRVGGIEGVFTFTKGSPPLNSFKTIDLLNSFKTIACDEVETLSLLGRGLIPSTAKSLTVLA